MVAVHELAGEAVRVELPVGDGEALVDLFGTEEHPLPAALELEPFGARWFLSLIHI